MGNKNNKELDNNNNNNINNNNNNNNNINKNKNENLNWNTIRTLAKKSHFNTSDVKQLFELFKKVAEASPNSDVIHRYQFREALETVGLADLNDDILLNRLFQSFDEAKDEQINFTEFVLGLSVACRGEAREKLLLAFNVFDLENTGYITKDEMKRLLYIFDKQAQNMTNKVFVDQESRQNAIENFVNKVFDAYDREQNGQLSFDEFAKVVLAHPSLTEMESQAVSNMLDNVPTTVQKDMHHCDACFYSLINCGHGKCCRDQFIQIGLQKGWLIKNQATGEIVENINFISNDDSDKKTE